MKPNPQESTLLTITICIVHKASPETLEIMAENLNFSRDPHGGSAPAWPTRWPDRGLFGPRGDAETLAGTHAVGPPRAWPMRWTQDFLAAHAVVKRLPATGP